jgi:hypothetical protein
MTELIVKGERAESAGSSPWKYPGMIQISKEPVHKASHAHVLSERGTW